jgi:hypothetical protein
MRLADLRCAIAMLALCVAGTALGAAADPPAYGKVDTFEPGKKYNCVPTADRKGWDCKQIGKAENNEKAPAPPPSQAEPAPAPAGSPPSKISTLPPASIPPAPSGHSSELPSYLSAAAANGSPPPKAPVIAPAGPSVTAAAPKPQISTNPQPQPQNVDAKAAPVPAETVAPSAVAVEPARAPASAPEPSTAAPVPRPAPAPVAMQEPPPAPSRATAAALTEQAIHSDRGFLALPGAQFVIEIAHGEREADIASVHASVHVPHGEVYELHLRQNGADLWLLLWGSFADIGSARAARAELSANGSITPGWPRRIAPLQAEAARIEH